MSKEDIMKALEACTATSDYWLHNHSNKCIISSLNCTDWSEDTYIKLMEENNMNNDIGVKPLTPPQLSPELRKKGEKLQKDIAEYLNNYHFKKQIDMLQDNIWDAIRYNMTREKIREQINAEWASIRKQIMEENNMNNNDMDVKITINLIEEDTEEETENKEEPEYENDITIKVSDIIKERYGEELEELVKITKYCQGPLYGGDDYTYKRLMNIILERIPEKETNKELCSHLFNYYNGIMNMVRYRVVSCVVNHVTDGCLKEYIESDMEWICENIIRGFPNEVVDKLDAIE